MWKRRVLSVGVLGVGFAVMASSSAQAATGHCVLKYGMCEVSNDGFDWIECECQDGSGVGGGGGDAWAGLDEAQLTEICFEELAAFCGPVEPPDGVPCMGKFGTCYADNDPEDSLTCECGDGGGGGFFGGDAWAGFTDEQLFEVCMENVDLFCGPPPPPVWDCENEFGACDVEAGEKPFYWCECANGGGGGGSGDPSWNGMSEDELLQTCFGLIESDCQGVDPTEGDTGNSTDPSGTGEGTSDSGDTEASASGNTQTSGGTETSDTAPSTESSGNAGETTAAEASASDSASASASATMTAGEESSGGAGSSEGTAGGDGGGDPAGCACSADGTERRGWLGLGLLGLLGLRSRRRRA